MIFWQNMKILGIETSCDETAIAVLEIRHEKFLVLSNIISSQVKVHAPYGGVVPSLAKREHEKNLVPILLAALKDSGISKIKLRIKKKPIINSILEREPVLLKQFTKCILPLKITDIDLIAVTSGPGLEPALWSGINFAKALAKLWRKPLIGVNHLEGHIYSNWLPPVVGINYKLSAISFPILNLVVSGGHTMLVFMRDHGKYKLLGETRDDAAGEAFDKVARMLGLGYPGGPAISAIAEQPIIKNRQSVIKLPRPMLNAKNYDFSFSGLKTAVFYLVKDIEKRNKKPIKQLSKLRSAIAKEFQNAVTEVLIKKTLHAAKEYKVSSVMLSGGVSANKLLRETLAREIQNKLPATNYQQPDLTYTGDNAAMIALAGYFRYIKNKATLKKDIKADANLPLIA